MRPVRISISLEPLQPTPHHLHILNPDAAAPFIHTPQRQPSSKPPRPHLGISTSIRQQASDPVQTMALRALDNTLPAAVADQRPKKAAKLLPTPPARSPTGSGVNGNGNGNGKKQQQQRNDENSAPTPKPASPVAAEPAVEYVRSEDLPPVPSPKARAAGLVAGLDSKDWVKVCESLNDARRLAVHHPALLAPILEKVVLGIVKTMKNPRSAVLKTSVMACADVFAGFGNLISSASADAFDKLLLQLLLKASQDKRFVCEEAEKAMRAMATSMPPLPLLKKLRAYVHHANLRVRAKAAVAMAHCAARMDVETMKEFGLPALLQVAAELLNDRLPEAREAARSIVGSTHAAFFKEAVEKEQEKKENEQLQEEVKENEEEEEKEKKEEPSAVAAAWESLCALSLSPISAQAVAKIVSQLQPQPQPQ
uniref:TOG domain-containing protein n=1 Tax=Hordeum vulgare subsp. vulgare TaxID=112509 RepID=A0A8I6Y1C4_HORVV